MNKIFKFGEDVKGYNIPVLNEREVRAAAGILFVILFISIMIAGLKSDFLMIKYAITMFFIDILIRVLINPKYSPFLILGRLIVRNQTPEYVGAQQKKFAWVIGIILSGTVFVHLVVVNAFSPITGLGCLICLIFLFFESAFGICLGCIVYKWIYKEKAQYCPGEVCEVKSKQDIQKTSGIQLLIVLLFITFISVTFYLLKDGYNKHPYDLFGLENTEQAIK